MGLGLEPSGPCSITHLTSSLSGRELLSGSQLAHKGTPGDLHMERHKHSQGTEPMQTLALANPDTAQPREGYRSAEMHTILSCSWHTRTPALTWSLSHTESRKNTQAPGCTVAPQLWFLQKLGEREGGPEGRELAVTPPPHLTGTRSSLSEEVEGAGGGGVGGGGKAPGFSPLFPSLLPGSVDFLSPPAPLADQTFTSLTSPPAASSADLGWNPEFPRTLPGKGVGEVAPQWMKRGRGLARGRGPVGRAARRRWPGARAPRAWCADFFLLSPGQRQKSRGTSV